MNYRNQHFVLAIACFSLTAILTTPARAVVTPFTDFGAFQSLSGATAEEAMPSTGSDTSQVVGDMTFTLHPPSSLNFKNWTSLLPGFELALNGVESYNIDFASPITGLGFDWVDVSDPQDTLFTIDFFSGGAGGTNVGASTFTSNDVENTPLFQGFTSTASFDRVQIREIGNDVQNEFFGQFYTGGRRVIVNTDARTITGDGDGDPNAVYGVPFTTSVAGGIATFNIAGDLNIGAGEILQGTGSNGASLRVANDVNISAGANVDFSAVGSSAGPGGGSGGNGSAGNVFGGLGASATGFPSAGGLPGTPGIPFLFGGVGGPSVGGAFAGNSGQASSDNSLTGDSGSNGINSPSSAGAGGDFGAPLPGGGPGGGNAGGCNLFVSGICVRGGAGGNGGAAGGGNGSPGGVGAAGAPGGTGGVGTRGIDGEDASNTGVGTVLSGGGGGGGASGGSGGGGGGSAGGGAGGGGGGGGGGADNLVGAGGIGGAGGSGGIGNVGVRGGGGGNGGGGGGGGGAFEIIANGRVAIAGELQVQGADGAIGGPGKPGDVGMAGIVGSPGSGGSSGSFGGGSGATGGRGGRGGRGGHGGLGGAGGNGGGGAGGTVKIVGSVTETGSASVDTSGGAGAGDGRFIFGNNIVGGYTGTAQGGGQTGVGAPRDANPFVSGNPNTPFIPDLEGGAEVYGLTGLDADTDLASVVNAAPANAFAALVYQDVGPTGFDDDYEGFDMLLVLNLSEDALTDVMFGAGSPGFEVGLLQRGVAENPEFGGNGEDPLAELGSSEVYATLVPDTTNNFQLSAMGISGSVVSMSDGMVLYLVTGQPGDFDNDGDVDGADFLAWQRGEVSNPPSASDLADWEENYGAPSPIAASTTVPEPGAIVLFALAMVCGAICHRKIERNF